VIEANLFKNLGFIAQFQNKRCVGYPARGRFGLVTGPAAAGTYISGGDFFM
jgi:hypothetical protein